MLRSWKPGSHEEALKLKGHCHGDFSAIVSEAGLKPWLSAITHTRNAPRTSGERYQVKY